MAVFTPPHSTIHHTTSDEENTKVSTHDKVWSWSTQGDPNETQQIESWLVQVQQESLQIRPKRAKVHVWNIYMHAINLKKATCR